MTIIQCHTHWKQGGGPAPPVRAPAPWPARDPTASPRPHGLIAPAWTRTVLSLVCASLRFSQNLERNGRSTLWGSSVYFLLCN